MKGIIPPPFLFFTAHPTFPFSDTVEKRAQLKACNFLFKVSKTKPLQTMCTVSWVWGRSILPEIVPHPENKTRTFRDQYGLCARIICRLMRPSIFFARVNYGLGVIMIYQCRSILAHRPCWWVLLVTRETTHVWKQGVHGKSAHVPLIFNVT